MEINTPKIHQQNNMLWNFLVQRDCIHKHQKGGVRYAGGTTFGQPRNESAWLRLERQGPKPKEPTVLVEY